MKKAEKILISPAEACEMLSIGRTTMYRLIHSGDIPTVKLPNCRKIFIHVDELNRFISSCKGGEDNE